MIDLIHFAKPINGAQHLLATREDSQMSRCQRTYRANLIRAAHVQGIALVVALTIEGDHATERTYKQLYKKRYTYLCPICNPRKVRKFRDFSQQRRIWGYCND